MHFDMWAESAETLLGVEATLAKYQWEVQRRGNGAIAVTHSEDGIRKS